MSDYPRILPLFPLTGVLLLPGAHIPLHIFEQRYRNMLEDVLAGEPYIGLIQPLIPRQDNRPDAAAVPGQPPLYGVGCVGLIEHWERLPDGRYVVLIQGVHRFRALRELPLERGYRRMEVDYREFGGDLQEADAEIDAGQLMSALKSFASSHQIALEFDRLSELSGHTLLNSMAMALPFDPAEKQALLEAPDLAGRFDTLLALMTMGLEIPGGEETPSSLPN